MNIPDVEQEAPKIPYIEEHKERNREIKVKVARVMAASGSTDAKVTLDEAKGVLLEALKSPYALSNLQQLYA